MNLNAVYIHYFRRAAHSIKTKTVFTLFDKVFHRSSFTVKMNKGLKPEIELIEINQTKPERTQIRQPEAEQVEPQVEQKQDRADG